MIIFNKYIQKQFNNYFILTVLQEKKEKENVLQQGRIYLKEFYIFIHNKIMIKDALIKYYKIKLNSLEWHVF